jgi:SAM-dependent methyltransferase
MVSVTPKVLKLPVGDGVPEVLRYDADPADLSPRRIAATIQAGGFVTDRAFDRFLALEHESVSAVHWTPVFVARRAAQWLGELDVQSVVDIGAGVGKFCVAAALAGRCHFTGIEQRPRFVAAARALADLFDVTSRVRFIQGALGEVSVPDAEAFYLYNPFGENLFGPEDHLDADVELGSKRYARDVADVEDLLRNARVGTYLISYNGFGGRVPDTYEEIRVDRNLPNLLKMWRKTNGIGWVKSKRTMQAGPDTPCQWGAATSTSV